MLTYKETHKKELKEKSVEYGRGHSLSVLVIIIDWSLLVVLVSFCFGKKDETRENGKLCRTFILYFLQKFGSRAPSGGRSTLTIDKSRTANGKGEDYWKLSRRFSTPLTGTIMARCGPKT